MQAMRWQAWRFILPALVWTLAFFVLPFVFMVVMSLWQRVGGNIVASWNLDNYLDFFAKPHHVKALINSIEISLTVTVLSIIIAYPLAWIISERVPARWQRTALILAVLPFWTSYVVRSYSWLLVLGKQGVFNNFLIDLGAINEPLSIAATRYATIIGFVHFFAMLLTLTIYANLKQLSPNYAKAAADLGAGPWRCFWFVILPLTLPGIMVGAFLTFVLCIGDYITPKILGGSNELVLPQLIMLQIGRRADFPSAAAMSILLMLVVTLAYLLCMRWLKMTRS
ncbi:MAG: ABC transporter permease [Granulosicoccus sp.]|nr:ABC transporter permease [Granulosicoccus sp.]